MRSWALRILAFDHFYSQDIDALRQGLGPSDSLDVLAFERLGSTAAKIFPEVAFTGVSRAYQADMVEVWERYRPVAHRFADWVQAAYDPNVFVVPSDTFFYLRPVIERLRSAGVPTAVVQKETTISPDVMDLHSREVGRWVPYMSDVMTVCSQRHKDFWVRSGAPAASIHVTGQPRFDIYSEARTSRSARASLPRLLYLSYDDDAYLLPGGSGVLDSASWREQRRATEEAIADVAGTQWDVTAKRHPQQVAQDDWLGSAVERADNLADTRTLIVSADAVIGFQTTALFEAALAGKPVLYAAWGDVYEQARPALIPFHEYGPMATHVTSAGQLRSLLTGGPDLLPRPKAESLAIVEQHLGPTDGRATQRVLQLLRDLAGSGRPRPVPARHLASASCAGLAGAAAGMSASLVRPLAPSLAGKIGRRTQPWRLAGSEAIHVWATTLRLLTARVREQEEAWASNR